MLYPPLLRPINWSRKDVMIQSMGRAGDGEIVIWEINLLITLSLAETYSTLV
jgi:hypothetical protein